MVRLSSVEVANYRPFRDMTKITFSDDMNILVGENNVGKSTVFRAIDTSVTDSTFSQSDPHDKTRPADLLVRLNLLLNDAELGTVVQKLLGGPIETTKLPSELKAVTVSKSLSSHSIRFGELYFFMKKDIGSYGFFSSQVPDSFQHSPSLGRVAGTPGTSSSEGSERAIQQMDKQLLCRRDKGNR